MTSITAMQTIEFEFKDEVIKISLNRPLEFNAINSQMLDEFARIMENVKSDRNARAIILTGNGRAFCYGLDFQEIGSLAEEERKLKIPLLLRRFQAIIYTLATLERPVIAALNGFATGAGLDLALACDYRVAVDGAKLSSAYIKMGLIPDGGGTYFLPRMLGYTKALDLITRGTVITSEDAKSLGLVTAVVTPDRLMGEALALAKELAAGPTRAYALAKLTIQRNMCQDLEKALLSEGQGQLQCFASHDHAEAVVALKEKRKPKFRGY